MMKRLLTRLFVFCSCLTTAAPMAAAVIDEKCVIERTIIGQVTVVTENQTLNPSVFVVIDRRTGKITSLHTGFPPALPAGQQTCDKYIDGTGKYLIPGLVEMHGHLPFKGWDKARTEETYFLYLAAGVTTVRGMLGDAVQFTHRTQMKQGRLAAPNLYLAAPSLNGNTVNSPDQGRALVRDYAKQGYDLLKIHPGLTMADYKAIASEADKVGIKWGGHVPAEVQIETVLDSKQHTIDHMDGYYASLVKGHDCPVSESDPIYDAYIENTLASGTAIVPTQLLFNLLYAGGDIEKLRARNENKYMAAATIDRWTNQVATINKNKDPNVAPWRNRFLKRLADAGVPIALGSDAPQIFSVPGFSIWREIALMKNIGMTPQQILKAAGPTPGQVMAYTGDKFGAIKVGYRADLVLLSANPLEDSMNLTKQEAVIVNGKLYDRKTIDEKLASIKARHKR